MRDLQPELTVLSFGAGQDSTLLLEKYIQEPGFRERYAPNNFLVLMADTGDEHLETYQHVARTQERCARLGIAFHFITADQGFHSKSWPSLRGFYRRTETCGGVSFRKSCTDNLKLKPIYNYLEHYLSEHYGVTAFRKKGFHEFKHRYGRIRMLVGIAAGEEGRIADHSKNPNRWFRDCIEIEYPLVDMKMDRAACQAYIRDKGQPVPPPSNCILCPWMSKAELEFMRRFMPADLSEWIELEAAKLKRFSHLSRIPVYDVSGAVKRHENRNNGVFGKKSLPIVIKEVQRRFEHWTDDELREYKFSHGHCGSKY